MAEYSKDLDKQQEAKEALESGKAYEKFVQWITAQGGDISTLKRAEFCREVKAGSEGYICFANAEKIGLCAAALGAGREKKEDDIDYGAGVEIKKTVGDFVKEGETVALIYTSRRELLDRAEEMYLDALSFGKNPPKNKPHIYFTVR